MSTGGLRVAGPGVVLGAYPERPERRTSLDGAWGGAWLSRVFAWRGGRHALVDKLVKKVRTAQTALAGVSGQAWDDYVSALRARLAYAGAREALSAELETELETEALACVAVASERSLRAAPYDTQLFAAHVLLRGQLAEMATGEGKTLTVALAAGAAALAGVPVHVLTANDYLVARDCAALTPLFKTLGLTAGAVLQPMDQTARRAAYACDITYCTAKELVFDYLRDGLTTPRGATVVQSAAALSSNASNASHVSPQTQPLLRGLSLAIIDEADSILIDEARVPLILSRHAPDGAQACIVEAWRGSSALQIETHFTLDVDTRSAHSARLNAHGREALHAMPETEESMAHWLNRAHREELVTLALTARHVLKNGRDYVVQDGRVHIIDETTGRKAEGRAWSNGLQQLVELSAGCAPSPMLETAAQITYQRFFRRYLRLCGASGTLRAARGELYAVYGLHVVTVPLRLPNRRVRMPSRLYASTTEQLQAVMKRVRELQTTGRPVLIGTDSVKSSEALARHLCAHGLTHVVLNALQDQHEADVVANAGKAGAVTVATNMAGRGTDIVLDAAARTAGGLHVICCQQNSSQRIDRQLMGRCARQGDPGSYEFFVALDGPLLAQSVAARIVKKSLKNKYLRYFFDGSLGADAVLSRMQRAATRRQRRERAALMKRDERMNDSLAFSGAEQ